MAYINPHTFQPEDRELCEVNLAEKKDDFGPDSVEVVVVNNGYVITPDSSDVKKNPNDISIAKDIKTLMDILKKTLSPIKDVVEFDKALGNDEKSDFNDGHTGVTQEGYA